MECKFCNEIDKSKLMKRSRVVRGTVETIDICQQCFWVKVFEPEDDQEDKYLLSERESTEREIFK